MQASGINLLDGYEQYFLEQQNENIETLGTHENQKQYDLLSDVIFFTIYINFGIRLRFKYTFDNAKSLR
jgi:hypothetical protein